MHWWGIMIVVLIWASPVHATEPEKPPFLIAGIGYEEGGKVLQGKRFPSRSEMAIMTFEVIEAVTFDMTFWVRPEHESRVKQLTGVQCFLTGAGSDTTPHILPIEEGEEQRLWVPSMGAKTILTVEVGWPEKTVPIAAADFEGTSGPHHKKRRWEDQDRRFSREYRKKHGIPDTPDHLVPISLEDICPTYQTGSIALPLPEKGWDKLETVRTELLIQDESDQVKYHKTSEILF